MDGCKSSPSRSPARACHLNATASGAALSLLLRFRRQRRDSKSITVRTGTSRSAAWPPCEHCFYVLGNTRPSAPRCPRVGDCPGSCARPFADSASFFLTFYAKLFLFSFFLVPPVLERSLGRPRLLHLAQSPPLSRRLSILRLAAAVGLSGADSEGNNLISTPLGERYHRPAWDLS